MMHKAEPNPNNVSFRDPCGQIFRAAGRIFRSVYPEASLTLDHFLTSALAGTLQNDGKLVRTWSPDNLPESLSTLPGHLVEHQAVPFPTYPAEWCPEMLVDAGNLTLDLSEALLKSGWGLKDAPPPEHPLSGPKPDFR